MPRPVRFTSWTWDELRIPPSQERFARTWGWALWVGRTVELRLTVERRTYVHERRPRRWTIRPTLILDLPALLSHPPQES